MNIEHDLGLTLVKNLHFKLWPNCYGMVTTTESLQKPSPTLYNIPFWQINKLHVHTDVALCQLTIDFFNYFIHSIGLLCINEHFRNNSIKVRFSK